MRQLSLASTGRRTSCLGFGCMVSDRAGLRLLDAAHDAGVRHFDVARAYAYGLSEHYLGRFLRGRAGDVTVTTKYGLLAPPNEGLIRLLHKPLRPIVRRLRRSRVAAVDRQMTRAVQSSYAKAAFTAAEARASLDKSLRGMRLDHIDVFLMHEATVEDLANPELLTFLEACVASGRIGAFGVGGESHRVDDLYARRRPFCDVLQFDWSILAPPRNLPGVQRIHFRTFSKDLPALRLALSEKADVARRWSESVGRDVLEPQALAALMLKAALVSQPDALVLFTSRSVEHIQFNVRVAEDESLSAPATAFARLVADEGRSLLLGQARSEDG